MRFAIAHKLTSYLMIAFSFGALILSNEVSAVPSLIALAGIALSWYWEAPRIDFRRYERAWTAISFLALAYSVFDLLSGGDVLIVGAHFILYLVVAKLFNRRTCKDYLHVYVLSFLMLVAGTVLNAEVTYGLFFLGYVVVSTWALILFHLRREMEDNFLLKHSDTSSERVQVARILNSRRIVGRSFFVGTSAVSLTVFFASTVMFLAIPRIGFGLFFAPGRNGVSMAGFSDGVQLGGHGVIKDDDTVVMRVKMDGNFAGAEALDLHWRGVAFDYYENGEWLRSPRAPATRRLLTLEEGMSRHYLLYDRYAPARPANLLRGTLRQEIYLEPLGYDVLFGASMPNAFEFPTGWQERARKERNDEIRHPHQSGIKYTVFSTVTPPSPARLRAARGPLPDGYNVYLQLPDELPNSVRELAVEITRGATNNYDRAVAIESWLKSNMSYTLTMESPGNREPIAYFLFERKRGHCEYFSSAMTVMARAAGIPARNVNGFLGGEWNEYDEYVAVRAGDAHSWVEVFFPQEGWVTFDPTPAAAASAGLPRGELGFLDRMRRFTDTLRFKWFRWVIEYDLYRQMNMFREIGGWFKGGGDTFRNGANGAREFLREHRAAAIGVVAGALVVVLAVFGWRRRRGEPLIGAARGARGRAGPMANIYRATVARLSRRGYPRTPATTPREHAAALTRLSAPGAASLTELTELYYRAEYGGDLPAGALDRARALRAAIEAALRDTPRRRPARA